MFDTHWGVVEKKMKALGLVSNQPIFGKGQCGYADLNAGGFYFLLKDRDKIAEHLKSGYDKAFLALVAYDEDKDEGCVYFHRDYYVRRQGVTALGNL